MIRSTNNHILHILVVEVFLLCFFFVFSGCAPMKSSPEAKTTDIDCSFPCWGGIIPSVTTAEDADSLLRMNTNIDSISLQRYHVMSHDVFRFLLTDDNGEGSIILDSDQIVEYINYRLNYTLPLGEFDDYTNAEGFISVRKATGLSCYEIKLIFPTNGVEFLGLECDPTRLGSTSTTLSRKVIVDASTPLFEFQLFEPTDSIEMYQSQLADDAFFSRFTTWTGYGGYSR